MAASGRLAAMIQCAGDARELLQGALAAVQECDGLEDSSSGQSAPLDDPHSVMASLAEAAGKLAAIRSGEIDSEDGMQAELDQIHRTLEQALDALASDHEPEGEVAMCRRTIARALALVFASVGGSSNSLAVASGSTSPGRRASSALATAPSSKSSPTIDVAEIDGASLGLDDLDALDPSVRPFIRPEWLQGPASTGLPRQSLAPPSGERRSMERVILEVEVGLVSESNFYAGLTMDLSVGGLFVATYQSRPVGAKVELSFVLPDGPVITTPGEVRWLREPRGDAPPGMGVSFTELAPEDLLEIERFCQEREPLYHDVD